MPDLPLLNKPSILGLAGIISSVSQVQEPGAITAAFGIDQIEQIPQGQRVYTQKIRVITTAAYLGPVAIAAGLQEIGVLLGAPYTYPIAGIGQTEQDTGSFLQTILIEMETEDGKSWIVTLGYACFDIWHELGATNVQYMSFTPLDFPPIVRWSTAKYHRYYPTDVNGEPFVNSAGDPFENPPVREESTQCLTIILWNPTYDEPYAQSFRDTINSDDFLGFQPKTVKCKDIDGERIYTADYGYVWRIKFEFEIRRIALTALNGTTTIYGWQELVLDSGFRAFGGANGIGGPLAPIIIGGVPATTPVLLNFDGTANIAADPAAVLRLNGYQGFYLIFNNFPTSEFANLNIDPNILTANQ